MQRRAYKGLNSALLLQALLSEKVKCDGELKDSFQLYVQINWLKLGIAIRDSLKEEKARWVRTASWILIYCLNLLGKKLYLVYAMLFAQQRCDCYYLPCEPPNAASCTKQVPILDKEYALPSKQNTTEFDPMAKRNLQSKLIPCC